MPKPKDDAHFLRVICPHCDRRVKAPPDWAGREAECPFCRGMLRFPLSQQSSMDDQIEHLVDDILQKGDPDDSAVDEIYNEDDRSRPIVEPD